MTSELLLTLISIAVILAVIFLICAIKSEVPTFANHNPYINPFLGSLTFILCLVAYGVTGGTTEYKYHKPEKVRRFEAIGKTAVFHDTCGWKESEEIKIYDIPDSLLCIKEKICNHYLKSSEHYFSISKCRKNE